MGCVKETDERLVNACVLPFKNNAVIIFGANVGATITAQLANQRGHRNQRGKSFFSPIPFASLNQHYAVST